MRPAFVALILVALHLAGCATAPAVLIACPPVKPYSAEEQQRLAAELAALPAASPLVGLVIDYQAMRDGARACAASQTDRR